jgi:hypothetical protein
MATVAWLRVEAADGEGDFNFGGFFRLTAAV